MTEALTRWLNDLGFDISEHGTAEGIFVGTGDHADTPPTVLVDVTSTSKRADHAKEIAARLMVAGYSFDMVHDGRIWFRRVAHDDRNPAVPDPVAAFVGDWLNALTNDERHFQFAYGPDGLQGPSHIADPGTATPSNR